MLGNNSLSVSSLSAYLSREALNTFCSKLSFQGCLFSEQFQKIEIASPSGDKYGIFILKPWKIKMVFLSRAKSKNAYDHH